MATELSEEYQERLNRQIYAFGLDAQRRINETTILVSGFDGLGIEIVKNLILQGVGGVTIVDDQMVTINDLGSNFYLDDSQLGESRIDGALEKLQELNRYVNVNGIHGVVTEEMLASGAFQILVVVGATLSQQLEFNTQCRESGVKFIAAGAHGVFGYTFVDLGETFTVVDKDGEQEKEGILSAISKSTESDKTTILMDDGARHNLETGDAVYFQEIKGMEELNGNRETNVFDVTVVSPIAFTIDTNTAGLADHVVGTGRFTQVKQPVQMQFQDLASSLAQPEILMCDLSNLFIGPLHHAFAQGLSAFREANNRFPAPTSAEDADAVLEQSRAFLDRDMEDNEVKTIRRLARCASAVINPLAAVYGGVVGQEVMKACSGKFTPIKQFFYTDAEPALPENEFDNLDQFAPQNTRYDDLLACIGTELVNRIKDLNIFIVGAGAIGCEMLKNFAMMGVGCGAGGKVHCTDMDIIEKSNLSRQFLFRDRDVKQSKAETAVNAVRVMNNEMNIESALNRVGKEAEDIYDDTFWEAQNCVITALDNVQARMYLDGCCVGYKKPMLDSGTVGTKGSTQVVMPYVTESYASQADPPQEEFPMCLIKNFPYKIEHTISWAKSDFIGTFQRIPEDANRYVESTNFTEELKKDAASEFQILQNIVDGLVTNHASTWEDCLELGVRRFTAHFDHQIQQLLYQFPEDHLTKEGGRFWVGTKRAPTAVQFDAGDAVHMEYVFSAAMLYAENYGLLEVVNTDRDYAQDVCAQFTIPAWVCKSGLKIAATEEERKEMAKNQEMDLDKVERLRLQLPEQASVSPLTPVLFEKDDPTNYHISYIAACANLRARNYEIDERSAHEIKRIAGNIIPAIATTTAMVTGFVCVELLKVIQEKPIESYRCAFCNLAISMFTFAEPKPCETVPVKLANMDEEWNWSLWDNLVLEDLGNVTLEELLQYFEDTYGLEVTMMTFGQAMIYSDFASPKKLRVRKKMTMTQLVETVAKITLPTDLTELYFDVCAIDVETEDDAELPTCILKQIVHHSIMT